MVKYLEDRPSSGRTGPAARKPSRSGSATPLVGRKDELGRLTAALASAAEGRGSTIFLTGEPGIGKTRLAREALARAKERGFRVLEGRAFPLQAGLAYAPFLDAFGPLLHSFDTLRVESLVRGLPELGRLFGGPHLPALDPLGDPALEKTRLFEAISRLHERLASESPVALFIDDLHWADQASLELLQYLAHGLTDRRLLLLATYAIDALGTCRGLRTLTVSLQRAGLAEEIAVPRLGSNGVDKLTRGILGGEPPEQLLALLDARAAGTPLFVEALIYALVDGGGLVRSGGRWVLDVKEAHALPPSVRHLILERLERLAPAERGVVELIAIMGDVTSHPILRAAGGLGEDALIEALRHLRSLGLVAERMDGLDLTYSITHPLIQEVAHDELPEAARRRAHLAAIAALRSFSGGKPDDVSRLARHYRGAGPEADPDQALTVLVAAGERSLSLYANEEAAQHLSAALAVVRQGSGGTLALNPSASILSHVLERLGEAWERLGEGSAAVGAWNEALVLQSEGREQTGLSPGTTAAASRLHRLLALAEWDLGHFDIANDHLRAGLVLQSQGLAGPEPCQELAELHYTRFRILCRLGDVAGMENAAAELLTVAKRLGSRRAEAEANLAASISCLWQDEVASARQRALEALTIGESLSEGQELAICCRAHIALTATGMRLGDHQFVRCHAERGLTSAHRLGAPTLEVVLRLRLAYASLLCGEWDEALRANAEAISLARRVGHPRVLAYALAERAMIAALRGEFAEADTCVAEAKMAFGSGMPADSDALGLVDIAAAALAIERGQTERALVVASGFGRLSPTYIPVGLMLLAEAQVAAGDPEGALATAAKLRDLGPAETPYLSALASRAEGLAVRALGRWEAAMACSMRAHEKFTALEMPFEAARSLLEYGVSAAAVQPAVAANAVRRSLPILERLGAAHYCVRARRLLKGWGIAPLATRRKRLSNGYLTARELRVACLVAEGLTNAEIGDRLILSRRTVGRHLENIYARLGIGSRSALARYVIEAGLYYRP